MQSKIMVLLQDLLGVGGGLVVTHGWLSASTEQTVAGIIVSVAGVVLGQLFHTTTPTP